MDENQNNVETKDNIDTKFWENEACVITFTYRGFVLIGILTTLFFVSVALFADPKDTLTAEAGLLVTLLILMLIGAAIIVVNCYSMILLKRKFGEHLDRNYFVSDHLIGPDERKDDPILYEYWSQENVYIYYTRVYDLV